MPSPITSVQDLGRHLRQYRKTLGLTQKDLNDRFKLRQGTISAIENGTPGITLETFFQVMTALELGVYLAPRPPLVPLDREDFWS